MKTLIYDCEIIKCIPEKNNDPDYEYCRGWRDFPGMGISVIGTWVSWLNGIFVFPHPNFRTFQELVDEAELVVGFNSIAFDDNLCEANGIKVKTDYDLLLEVWSAAGMPREYTYGVTRPGYNLNNLARVNLGKEKSGKGEYAPKLWQDGKKWSVIDYNVDDILLTKQLWDRRDRIIDPTDTSKILKLKEI